MESGADGCCDVGAGVDEEAGAGVRGAEELNDFAGDSDKIACGKVLLAKLDEIDPGGGEPGGLLEQTGLASGLGFSILGTIGDGVAIHEWIAVFCPYVRNLTVANVVVSRQYTS